MGIQSSWVPLKARRITAKIGVLAKTLFGKSGAFICHNVGG